MKSLRPYQAECHEAVISEYNAGIIRQLIVLFTGAGKTFLLIKLLERMGFKRILWLSFQTELVSQSAMAFIRDKWPELHDAVDGMGFLEYVKLPDAKIGCIKEDLFKVDTEVTMGSVMTVYRRLNRIERDYFDCVVCDEAHLFMSQSSFQILSYLTPKLLIGCTATPHRTDGLPLSDIFQKITFDYGLDKGIKDGWACELDAVRVKTNCNLDGVKTTAGEFNLKDLTDQVNTLARNQLIVESYKKYCDGRPCIAFCVDISHAIDLAVQFKLNGYDCEAVSSNKDRTPNRKSNIRRYKDGKLKIVTNVDILVAGFDMVDTGCIIMACPTKSLTKYLQAVGRGARLKNQWYIDKYGQTCTIIDIVDNTSRHSLVNAWELDKKKDVEDRTFVSKEKKEKLLTARQAKLDHQRKEDEVVKLLAIPKLKISKSWKMSEDATPAQLEVIERWGYPVKDVHYTKTMISEIFGKQPAHPKSIQRLKDAGYDVSGFISVAEAQLAEREIEARKEKERRNNAKNTYNNTEPF